MEKSTMFWLKISLFYWNFGKIIKFNLLPNPNSNCNSNTST